MIRRGLLIFLLVLGCALPARGGSPTTNDWLYLPGVGARGTAEKTLFDAGLERVDARLAKEVWVGDPNYGSTLQAAITAIGATPAILRVPAGTHSVAADLSIPANITLRAERGASFAIATAVTLTINGGLDAGPYPIFSCTGTGKVQFADGTVPVVMPEWFGAAGDGTTNSTAAIKSAGDSLPTTGGVVSFGVGTYLVTSGTIVVTTPGTRLQGQGAANDGSGTLAGTALKSAAGTGKLVAFQGSSAAAPLDSCQINDISLAGNDETVQGLSLKWVSNFRQRNVWVNKCLDHGVYLEQVWDSSFYDLEVEWCGDQATSKAGLYIYNGATDNSNNLRFYAFHAETNYGDDVWIDSSGAGTGGNYNIFFLGGKAEKNTAAGDYSTKAFHVSGWDGATGAPNQNIVIRDFGIVNYYEAGDIGIHFAGDGFMAVDGCLFTNASDGATGIKVEGPVVGPYTHKLTNNSFSNVEDEITIDTATIGRNRVWTYGNTNTLYSEGDSRIHINDVLVKDRIGLEVINSITDTPTSGTGEDIIATCTVPANLLYTNAVLKVVANGYATGAAGNKTIKLYFGADAIEVFPAGAIGDYQGWRLEAEYVVTDWATVAYAVKWNFILDGAPAVISSGWSASNEDFKADTVLKITGQCADGADAIRVLNWRVAEE